MIDEPFSIINTGYDPTDVKFDALDERLLTFEYSQNVVEVWDIATAVRLVSIPVLTPYYGSINSTGTRISVYSRTDRIHFMVYDVPEGNILWRNFCGRQSFYKMAVPNVILM